MAGTTFEEDCTAFTRISGAFGKKTPTMAKGALTFAGALWPPRNNNTLKYRDVEYAIGEAREMIIRSYMAASGALRGAGDAEKMIRWFGPRNQKVGFGTSLPDWWEGARAILGAIESFIVKSVSVYYRGDQALVGSPNDYPGRVGNLVQRDVDGYAESFTSAQNNIIGLCKLFFAKRNKTGQSRMNLKGKDSVGGTLLHELSHNICGTDDHEKYDDTGTCYGTGGCIDLATHKVSRAWYNADNIEYFCEDVMYGIP